MRVPRVFLTAPLKIDDTVELPTDACEHLLRVLRMPDGARLVLCNGDGSDYRAQLVATGKRNASARIVDASANHAESPLQIVLAQALARGEKMDWVIQKATELGATAIQPIVTERTEVHLDSERAQKRMAHWLGVATSASEQSGRALVPTIGEPTSLATYLAGIGSGVVGLTLDPEGAPISEILDSGVVREAPTIHLVVGPEGGLSDRDRAQLLAAGFWGMRLGPRILRTETAGPAALAVMQAALGDLR